MYILIGLFDAFHAAYYYEDEKSNSDDTSKNNAVENWAETEIHTSHIR